jgi:hypothetical protein
MIKLVIFLISLIIILFLAIHPALTFRFEAHLGRRSMHLHGLTHEGVCMVMVARKELSHVRL